MNMWTNGFYPYGDALQRDTQPINWYNQNNLNGISNPPALRFDNYMSGATNPFAGQMYAPFYQANSGFGNGLGYQYRGW